MKRVLPFESTRACFAWSVAAGLIFLLWIIGVLGAGTAGFFQQYTFTEVLHEIATDDGRMFWPGEFGNDSWWPIKLIQLSPLFPLIMWPLCVWRSLHFRMRLAVLTISLLPIVLTLANPVAIVIAPFLVVRAIALPWYGEEWQEGLLIVPAAALWCWMIVALFGLTVWRGRPLIVGHCQSCGYCTKGLLSGVCPECGTDLKSPRKQPRRDGLAPIE